MFTGIVEEIGKISRIEKSAQSALITIAARKVLEDAEIGDSIAVNGVCLTVVSRSLDRFSADISAETLRSTNLGDLWIGSFVNLERSVRLADRLGGHLVQGHVDEVGEIIASHDEGNSTLMRISISDQSIRYVVHKGSITVDGVSLTIANLDRNSFEIALIPHTKSVTTFGQKRIGDKVNIEVDLIGRYVERLLNFQSADDDNRLNDQFLKEHGYA